MAAHMHHPKRNSSMNYTPSSSTASFATATTDSGPQSSTYLDYRSSIDTTPSWPASHHASSSRTSLRSSSRQPPPPPSYMANYQRSPLASKPQPIPIPAPPARVPTPPPPAPVRRGLLLLALAAEPPTSIVYYLTILLKRHAYSEIALVGTAEQASAIKQLKNDIYALIGTLKQPIGVSIHTNATWDEGEGLAGITNDLLAGGTEHLGAVVCTPEYDGLDTDLLTLDPNALARSWQMSVNFVLGVARACIPHMEATEGSPAVFAVLSSTAHSPAALVNKAATNTLVRQLDTSYASARGLAIGQAEQLLIPDPEPVVEVKVVTPPALQGYVEAEFKPSESPTRLWNMWALQDELGSA